MAKIYIIVILIGFTINHSYCLRNLDDSNTTVISNNSNPVDPSNNTNSEIPSNNTKPLDNTNNTEPIIINNNTTDNNSTQNNTYPKYELDITPKNYKDELNFEKYITHLNQEKRSTYLFWINYKNNFNAKNNSIAKLSKSFEPENPDYYQSMFATGWPFYFLSALCFVLILLYFILKIFCGYFKGPKMIGNFYKPMTYSLIFISLASSLYFYSFAMSRTIIIHNNVSLYSDYMNTQSDLLTKTVKDINIYNENLKILLQNSSIKNESINTNVYGYDSILEESFNVSEKIKFFSDNFAKRDQQRYDYEIATLILLPIFTVSGIIAFIFKIRFIVLASSLLLFSITIPSFVILGLDTSLFLLSIDYCQDVNKYISPESAITNKGIGYYHSCPTKPTQIKINTAKYEIGLSFNSLIKEVNNTIIKNYDHLKNGLGVWKRNNPQYENLIKIFNWEENDPRTANDLKLIINTNNILRNLDALSKCQVARNIINYGEDYFCYENLSNIFNNLIYLFLGIVSLLILSIEINKLIVLLNHLPKKSKKNMELLDEVA